MDIRTVVFILFAFLVLWLGSSLIVNTISAFAKHIRIPPFVFSFFIVGILTSIGEIAVAVNAVSIGEPEIFVGSLLGSTLVIFSLVIPLTALLARGIHIRKHLNTKRLLLTLLIIAAPAVLALDRRVGNFEALILVGLYISLFFIVRSPPPAFAKIEHVFEAQPRSSKFQLVFRLLVGSIALFVASRYIVEEAVQLSNQLRVSTFMIGLLVVAIGMSLPEFSLAIKAGRSRDEGVQDIAIGDFIGSAAANVLIFGVFTLINDGDVTTSASFDMAFIYIALALLCFFVFTRGKSKLTPKEGIFMIALYLLFVASRFMVER